MKINTVIQIYIILHLIKSTADYLHASYIVGLGQDVVYTENMNM